MPCPTCDHTLRNVSDGVYWCPRCGTLCGLHPVTGYPHFPDVPKLVNRVRGLQAVYPLDGHFNEACRHLGIDEATAKPAERGAAFRNRHTSAQAETSEGSPRA